MTKLDDLNAVIAQTSADTAELLKDIGAQVAALQAQILDLQTNGGVDLSGPIAALETLDATIKAATPAPTP